MNKGWRNGIRFKIWYSWTGYCRHIQSAPLNLFKILHVAHQYARLLSRINERPSKKKISSPFLNHSPLMFLKNEPIIFLSIIAINFVVATLFIRLWSLTIAVQLFSTPYLRLISIQYFLHCAKKVCRMWRTKRCMIKTNKDEKKKSREDDSGEWKTSLLFVNNKK